MAKKGVGGLRGGWVDKLVARPLGFESGHPSDIINGRHKLRYLTAAM